VVHTTEGSTVKGAIDVLRSNSDGANWVIGEGRIIQGRPIGAQGASLRQHNDVGQQVECVGHAKEKLHRLTADTWEPLIALTAFLHEEFGMPLRRPEGWADDCSDITTILATNNTRRLSRKALGFRGLLGHLDIPDQAKTWHWDPGALDYTALIDEAGGGMQLSDKIKIAEDEELTIAQVFRRLIQATERERERDAAERERAKARAAAERERDAAERARNQALLSEVAALQTSIPDPAAFAEAVSMLIHDRLQPQPTPEPGDAAIDLTQPDAAPVGTSR
jgi:N-acetylmuramoyl-L-alanine amidase